MEAGFSNILANQVRREYTLSDSAEGTVDRTISEERPQLLTGRPNN